ncbi:permease [Hwanghaeella sp.]|uniref:permease n=1 Tax=Hwanghaeella sp. TaxID=2605943 RepID=UPI003CCBF310
MSDAIQQTEPESFDSSRNFASWTRQRIGSIDRVFLTALAVAAVWLILDLTAAQDGILATGGNLLGIAPFIILSVLLAAYLKATGADGLIAKAFAGNIVQATFLAAIVGALSPFCSCGVVPLIAALLASGVPLAPVMAFWLASPIMDPEMFVVTAAVLGTEFTVIKTAAAVGIGLMGGFTVLLLGGSSLLRDPLIGTASTCGTSAYTRGSKPVWRFWEESNRKASFSKEAKRSGWFLTKWLTLAFLLEAVMLAYAPMQQIGEWLSGAGALAIPAAAVIGVPAYLNGYAAIPLTSGLMEMGLTAPAALTFMVAGAVTSIPAAIAVKALVRLPVFLLYLGIAMSGSVVIGLTYALAI